MVMTLQSSGPESEIQISALPRHLPGEQLDLQAALEAALAREQVLLRQAEEVAARQQLQTRELNHRLFNGLQSIASLLSSQSRTAHPEAAAQLTVAISRIFAFGQVHRRLHLLDHQQNVEFTQYLVHLCADLSTLLLVQSGSTITVEGDTIEIPAATAIPLGFIVNELITNCAKYAEGDIIVRLRVLPSGLHSLSVADQGQGLPPGFDIANSDGLGLKIVQALVSQIEGELLLASGDGGRGSCTTVTFLPAPAKVASVAPPASSEVVRRWITQANIDQFKVLVATETDPTKRAIFTALLAEERRKESRAG
jgi:two-component sensor histidine kinase